MDQRYYKESDIELLKKVKHLKEQGFQLKAIKMLLSNLNMPDSADSEIELMRKEGKENKVTELMSEDKLAKQEEETSLIPEDKGQNISEQDDTKMGQFQAIMNHIILAALKENNGILTEEIGVNVTEGVVREMNYLMRLKEEKEEERFKKFDAALREYQKSRSMAAVSVDKNKKKSKFFKKNKVYI
jgi:DNA-binding transcriptional MerR regulator